MAQIKAEHKDNIVKTVQPHNTTAAGYSRQDVNVALHECGSQNEVCISWIGATSVGTSFQSEVDLRLYIYFPVQ